MISTTGRKPLWHGLLATEKDVLCAPTAAKILAEYTILYYHYFNFYLLFNFNLLDWIQR